MGGVGEGSSLLGASLQVLKLFQQELECRQLPDDEGSFGVVIGGSGVVIVYKMAMCDQGEFWVVWERVSRLIGCIFVTSQAISTKIGVEAIAWLCGTIANHWVAAVAP